MRPAWWKNWAGETAVIVASGPSAASAGVELALGRAKCITVNSSWQLAPWADVLLATDATWWEVAKGCPKFKGVKLTADPEAARRYGVGLMDVDRSQTDRLILDGSGKCVSGNSGFSAVNMAANFGARRILLVGLDCSVADGLHWHGAHVGGLNNPDEIRARRWRALMDNAAADLAAAGIEAINCSLASTLTAYPKMTLKDALCRK